MMAVMAGELMASMTWRKNGRHERELRWCQAEQGKLSAVFVLPDGRKTIVWGLGI
jgi:hypothetical protein